MEAVRYATLVIAIPVLAVTILLGACVSKPPPPVFSSPLELVIAAVEDSLGIPVTLEIHDQRSDERWFFLTATPLTETGEPVDYANTRLNDNASEGELDNWLCALLQKSESNQWQLLELEIGATDVPFIDWPDRHGVPRALIMGGVTLN